MGVEVVFEAGFLAIVLLVVTYAHFVTGIWFRDFGTPYQGVLIAGDPDAVGRTFWDTINPWAKWRKQWKWILLKVETEGGAYVMRYCSGGRQEEFSAPLWKVFIAVQIGPGDVHFWATRAGFGGDARVVTLSVVSPLMLKRDLKLWCKEQGIDHCRDVRWI